MMNNNLQTTSCKKESPIKVCIATTPTEKREIYHFRYQIYVEEMSKHTADIDYNDKVLDDELDEWALLLYVKIGSEIIATERVNIGTLTDFPSKLVEWLSLNTFQHCYNVNGDHKFAFVTKLMVSPAYRSSSVLYLLMAKAYEICCYNQVQFVFGACNFHLLRLYEQMGFHRYGKNFVDSGYGLLFPIVLLANDAQHLRAVRSPLFRIACKREEINTQAVEWFHENFTSKSLVINSQIVSEEELWSILCQRLSSPPTQAITILHKLSITEAKKFLHCCGVLVRCEAGDIITNQGDFSYSYDILISGRLKSVNLICPVTEYASPGQHFGANGLTEHNKHTQKIAAIDSTEILVLSGIAFRKFFYSYPEIADKIVRSIIKLRSIK